MKQFLAGLLAATVLSASAATAADFAPAVLYDLGGKFDKSFNEGVYAGAEKFKKDTGVEYRDFEPQNEAQKLDAARAEHAIRRARAIAEDRRMLPAA